MVARVSPEEFLLFCLLPFDRGQDGRPMVAPTGTKGSRASGWCRGQPDGRPMVATACAPFIRCGDAEECKHLFARHIDFFRKIVYAIIDNKRRKQD